MRRTGTRLAVRWCAVSTLAFAIGGCFDAELSDEDLSDEDSALTSVNGQSLNGQSLNGQGLNGQGLNGSELGRFVKWVKYDDARLADGAKLKHVHLVGSQLVGKQHHWWIGGTALVGARFDAKSDTNKKLTLRIAAVYPPATGDVWQYRVDYRETDGSWVPVCADGATPVNAIALDGWWDVKSGDPGDGSKHVNGNRFTFACRDVGALGKCIDAGYRPWASVGGVSLDTYHQACVRLIRADYCGTSVSHTVDGQLVNLYDDLGVQVDTDDWLPEAEWAPDGALCISPHTRAIDELACAEDLLAEDCATEFAAGGLLLSEAPEPP
jgi:hypothetical protein